MPALCWESEDKMVNKTVLVEYKISVLKLVAKVSDGEQLLFWNEGNMR
jgi:hypothetical protein